MANNVTMTYGDYSLSPVPLISIERQTISAKNLDNPVGYTFVITLNGTATPLPDGNTGLVNTEAITHEIRDAFNNDGKLFEVMCDSNTVIQCYPRIISVSFQESSNNWVNTIPYTIQLEYDVDESEDHTIASVAPFIEEISEEWNFEFIQDQKYFSQDLSTLNNQGAGHEYPQSDSNNPFEARVSRSISIVGKKTYASGDSSPTGDVTYGIENARTYLTGVYGLEDYNAAEWGHSVLGLLNLSSGTDDYGVYDHYRSHVVDEVNGSISVTDSWLIAGANTGVPEAARHAREDFSVNVTRGIDDGKVRLSVEGQIQGFEIRDYSTEAALSPVTTSAYTNATNAWSTLQARVYPRAQAVFQAEGLTTLLNPLPTNKTIGHQHSKGIITYSYEFDDRPCSFISGSLSEIITISHNHSTDVFAELVVIGRQHGPILQSIQTYTAPQTTVSIEAVMPLPEQCSSISDLDLHVPTGQVVDLLCEYETSLSNNNDQVFKSSDTENWSPLTGRYSRSVTWTLGRCAGSGIDTTFC